MDTPVITLTTDFGTSDGFVGTMKGVILSINPNARIVDITHGVPRGDIFAGAMVLRATCPYFPANSVHVAVVDPGVGTTRKPMAVETELGIFVLPDNGLISWIARDHLITRAYAIENPEYCLASRSRTFHGRDLFAPVAAHLSLGKQVDAMGPFWADYHLFDLPEPKVHKRSLSGCIIYRDTYGNLITNIDAEMLPRGNAVLEAGEHQFEGPHQAYGEVARGEALFLIGSQNLVEIAVNNGSAADNLDLVVGDSVLLRW